MGTRGNISFDQLVHNIVEIDTKSQAYAIKSINLIQTVRNWLIGGYIVEYEQHGNDRAKYGEQLLKRLSLCLKDQRYNVTLLKNSRSFYLSYPLIGQYIQKSPTLSDFSAKFISIDSGFPFKNNTLPICPTLSDTFSTPAETVLEKLSFSHIVELLTLKDPLVRFFYETECIKGTWSVRELRRQISTNLHIRVGLSKEKLRMVARVNGNAERHKPALQIRDPFTFEFLGLRSHDIGSENELEDALILHLQDFLLEMGKGFCFEACQKRIIIDGEYYFADLVFYNRLLHCSVIVEIKNDEFRHEHIGQLNAYVSYYAENEMQPGDNPPVGILLCTRKGKKMVEYAIGNIENKLFVSTYLLHLPDKKELEDFISVECHRDEAE